MFILNGNISANWGKFLLRLKSFFLALLIEFLLSDSIDLVTKYLKLNSLRILFINKSSQLILLSIEHKLNISLVLGIDLAFGCQILSSLERLGTRWSVQGIVEIVVIVKSLLRNVWSIGSNSVAIDAQEVKIVFAGNLVNNSGLSLNKNVFNSDKFNVEIAELEELIVFNE